MSQKVFSRIKLIIETIIFFALFRIELRGTRLTTVKLLRKKTKTNPNTNSESLLNSLYHIHQKLFSVEQEDNRMAFVCLYVACLPFITEQIHYFLQF